jgi:hypothetical protein
MKMAEKLFASAILLAATSFVSATPISYLDNRGDSNGSANGCRDIAQVTIDNDATNLYITLQLNPTATTNINVTGGTEAAADVSIATFNYGIGITTGPGAGGDLSTNALSHGNPYNRAISIDSSLGGMTNWIGVFGAGGAGSGASPYTSFGFNQYIFTGTGPVAGGWLNVGTVASGQPMSATGGATTNKNTITLTVPIAPFTNLALGTPGTTILFDVYTTGNGAGQTAYDSLASQAVNGSNEPLALQPLATFSATAQYNGTVLNSYTIQEVPEPASLSLLGAAGIMMLCRSRRR